MIFVISYLKLVHKSFLFDRVWVVALYLFYFFVLFFFTGAERLPIVVAASSTCLPHLSGFLEDFRQDFICDFTPPPPEFHIGFYMGFDIILYITYNRF